MAESAGTIWALAYHLYALAAVELARGAGPGFAGLLPEHWDVLALNSTSVKVHPDATGAPKKGQHALGQSHGEGNQSSCAGC